jgi:hypothetical protein
VFERQVRVVHLVECGWFWAWVLVGGATMFGLLVAGMLAVAPVALTILALASQPTIRRSAFGLFTGLGIPLIYVAWVQRAGPGTTCWHTATASGCDQHLNPLPWLVVGVVLIAAGIVAQARRF